MDKSKGLMLAALLCGAGSVNAHTVFLDPANSQGTVGSSVTVDLKGRNFFSQTDMGGVNLTFNPSVVQVESVTVNAATWETATAPAVVDNNAGTITALNVASATGHGPTFDLAEIVFKAVGAGDSALTLSENPDKRFTRAGQPTVVIPGFNAQNGTVSVAAAPVPVPAAFWLLGSAMVTMLMGRRKATAVPSFS